MSKQGLGYLGMSATALALTPVLGAFTLPHFILGGILGLSHLGQPDSASPVHERWKPFIRMTKTVKGQFHEILYVLYCPGGVIPEHEYQYKVSMHKRVNGMLELHPQRWRFDAFQRSVDSRLEWGWTKEKLDIEILTDTGLKEFLMPKDEIVDAP